MPEPSEDEINPIAKRIREQNAKDEATKAEIKRKALLIVTFPIWIVGAALEKLKSSSENRPSQSEQAPPASLRTPGMAPTPEQFAKEREEGVGGKVIDAGLAVFGLATKVIVVAVLLFLICGAIYVFNKDSRSRSTNSPQTATPTAQPNAGAPAGDQEAKRKEMAAATDELIHKFERTDAAALVKRDQFRAIIYAILQRIPQNRQEEAMEDMYLIASVRNGGTALQYLVNQTGDVKEDDQKMYTVRSVYFDDSILSKGTKDNYRTVWFAYTDTNRDCKQRGTDIIAEAKAKLGQ